jgi:hypothetical protein
MSGMTDILIPILLTGMAVTFVIEFLDLILLGIFTKPTLYNVLALPLSFLGLWAQLEIQYDFFSLVPATAFVVMMLNKYLNKPTVVGARLPRL